MATLLQGVLLLMPFAVAKHQFSRYEHASLLFLPGPTKANPPRTIMGETNGMEDLRVEPGPGAPDGLLIPGDELSERFSRASGPGGQGVNTTDSRVQLSLDLGTTTALDDVQRSRVLKRLTARLSGTVITVDAAEHRAQRRNREAARERLAELLREAVAPPIPRRPTRPTRGSQRRRLESKRRRSEVKRSRRRPDGD